MAKKQSRHMHSNLTAYIVRPFCRFSSECSLRCLLVKAAMPPRIAVVTKMKLAEHFAGARGLCCCSSEEVQSMLAAAPRWAVHRALAEREPRDYCTAGDPDAAQQLGVLPSMEDAAIAYRLLLEVRSVTITCNPSGVVTQQVQRGSLESDIILQRRFGRSTASHSAACNNRSSLVFFRHICSKMHIMGKLPLMWNVL